MSSVGSLLRLTELVPPPDFPTRPNGDWKRFTSVNGFPPPEDYRMMIREYGAGTFAGWLELIEPFNHSWTFMEKAEEVCKQVRRRQDTNRGSYPDWAVWPEPGGMLPWARTTTGDLVGWRTVGRSDRWTTLFLSGDGQGSSEHDWSAVEFILAAVAEENLGRPKGPSIERRPSFLPAPV